MAIRPTNQRHHSRADGPRTEKVRGNRRQSRSARRFWIMACLGVLATSSTGCGSLTTGVDRVLKDFHECIDESMVEYRNRAMAEKAWIRVRHCYHHRQYHRDIKDGFVSGYMDVAAGGNGCTPAIAPSEYWGWKYQSPAGQAAVNAWFEGFPLGAKAAEQDGVGYWQNIRMNLKTPMDPNAMGMEYGAVHGVPVPYVEGEEVIPAPLPAPRSDRPRAKASPSDILWEEQESDAETVDPESVFHEPVMDSSREGLRRSPPMDVEVASRSAQGITTKEIAVDDVPQEFSDAFVNDLFGPPAEYQEGADSDELPFSFE